MITVREEIMNSDFTKFHLLGLPFDAVIHRFTDARDEFPHQHPFAFSSVILKGSYLERIYTIAGNTVTHQDVLRKEGDTFRVEAETIHQILELPEGECYTLIKPEPWKQVPGFFRFEEDGIYYRDWNKPWEKIS